MDGRRETPNTLFTLFGASGDLSHRLILPALFNLYLSGQWPEKFRLIAVDRNDCDDEALAEEYRKAVSEHSRTGAPPDDKWRGFAELIDHMRMDIGDERGYANLVERLNSQEREWGGEADRVFYMALPPSLFAKVAEGLGKAGLAEPRERTRVVLEKPLGHDLDSFRTIDRSLHESFAESQVYRIDHFLGKETVQNILAMRFANPIYEPIWNRRYV
ncbi:MAG TPA: glucose-6-phosphate dehydrogenase, partial [Gammaproteobacteria bacterium]|nr:glucose-6-phosphate dehydrogenase [Gammaproteobacteria bacterium]